MIYSSLILFRDKKGFDQGNLLNILATIASLSFMVHEWLFTDQFLRVTQLLDRKVIEEGAESFEMRVERVNNRVNWFSVFNYIACVVWAIVCIVIGNFTFRMSKFVLIIFQTLVFLYCLLRLRSLTNEASKH